MPLRHLDMVDGLESNDCLPHAVASLQTLAPLRCGCGAWRRLQQAWSLMAFTDSPCRRPPADFGAIAVWVRRVAEAEEGLEAAPQAALVNALPALPVLLLGFVGQEVNEIVSGAFGERQVWA